MTNEDAKKMLKAKLECLKHETSGTDYACNQHLCEGCSLNYEQGNMGEQKEALDLAIKALEQLSSSEKPNKSETKIDCDNEDCNNCVNHKYCDYEPNKSEILTGSKSEDCISREAVKEMLTAEWTKYMPMESDVSLSFVLEKISEMPSVTPCDLEPYGGN